MKLLGPGQKGYCIAIFLVAVALLLISFFGSIFFNENVKFISLKLLKPAEKLFISSKVSMVQKK